MGYQIDKNQYWWEMRRQQNAFAGKVLEDFYRAVEGVDIDGLGEYQYYITRHDWIRISSIISDRLYDGECGIYSALFKKCSVPIPPDERTFDRWEEVRQEDYSSRLKVTGCIPLLDVESCEFLKARVNDQICGGKMAIERYADILFERVKICLDNMCIYGRPEMGMPGLTNAPGIIRCEVQEDISNFDSWKRSIQSLKNEFEKVNINIHRYGGITLFMDQKTLSEMKSDLMFNPPEEFSRLVSDTSPLEFTKKMMKIREIISVPSNLLESNEMIGVINASNYFHIPVGLRLTASPHDYRVYPTGNTHPFGIKLWTKTGIVVRKGFNDEVAICHAKPVNGAIEEPEESGGRPKMESHS